MSTDGKYYLAVYDALEQPKTRAARSADGLVSGGCDAIGTAFSRDGVSWQYSAMLTVQVRISYEIA